MTEITEITNQMLMSKIEAMSDTNDLTHSHLKEGLDGVTSELKEFREANSTNAASCKKELHDRITAVALKQATQNGRHSAEKRAEEQDKEPKTRRSDWIKENWKAILLFCFLSAAGGSTILPYIGKALGVTH